MAILIETKTDVYGVAYDDSLVCRAWIELHSDGMKTVAVESGQDHVDTFEVGAEYQTIEDAEAAARARAIELGWDFGDQE